MELFSLGNPKCGICCAASEKLLCKFYVLSSGEHQRPFLFPLFHCPSFSFVAFFSPANQYYQIFDQSLWLAKLNWLSVFLFSSFCLIFFLQITTINDLCTFLVPPSPNHTPNGGSRLGATVACVLFNHLQTINTLLVTFILKENASLEPFVVVVSNVVLK